MIFLNDPIVIRNYLKLRGVENNAKNYTQILKSEIN
jgi:3-methyladenine DNA glycosylase Tag